MPAATSDGAVLGRRQLYILPTSYGLVFSLVLMVLLLAAINYGSALAYGLTFLLGAIGIVSMIYTHRNLLGLQVTAGPCTPVFAGDNAAFQICLNNASGPRRLGVIMERDKAEVYRLDLREGEQRCVQLEVATTHRGYLAAPPLVISTRFPLGLLHAWTKRVRLDHRCLVYPRPAAPLLLPTLPDPHGAPDHGLHAEGDDFRGLREFRAGDSPRHVSWKAVARGQGMLTKQFGGGFRASVWLDWDTLPRLDAENRLRQLCRWVLDCEDAGLQYGLRLPGNSLAPASGEHHRQRCLSALALFPGPAHATDTT
ncbi:MAG: DUF58 domain-containing protein [Acidiferrobacterales bacterium]